MNKSIVNLPQLVENTMELLKFQAQRKQIDLKQVISPDIPE